MRGFGPSMWEDPELYDLENSADPEFDLGFWSGLVSRLRPARVLELACGTGRLTLPLARQGVLQIVGLDASASFLARASARLSAEPGLRVTFVEGDMRAPAVEGEFDLVFVPFNSLMYLTAPSDRIATLRAARRLLAPDGRFAFDVLAPRYDLLAEAMAGPPITRLDIDHAAPEMGVRRFLRTSADTYDPATQTLSSVNRYEIHRTDGTVEHRLTDLDWHIWFPAELELAVEAAGLTVAERFGGYGGEPWGPSSRRMLWVCAAA